MELSPELGAKPARSVIAPALFTEPGTIQGHLGLCKNSPIQQNEREKLGMGHYLATPGSSPLSSHWEHSAVVAHSASFRASQPFLNDSLFTQERRNSFLATVYMPNADFLF